jgi:hypothetical protein
MTIVWTRTHTVLASVLVALQYAGIFLMFDSGIHFDFWRHTQDVG